MYPWISRTLDFWLQFCEKRCGLYMDVYGIMFCNLSHFRPFVEARAAHHGVGMYEEIGE